MKYLEFKPNETLSQYIQLIWMVESESTKDYYPREKILPDGIVEIIFHFGESFITYNAKNEKMKQSKCFAISQMKEFIEIESDGLIGFVSVRFFPWGAHHFFDEPICNFIDNSVDIQKIWPDDAEEIMEKIALTCNEYKVDLVQQFLEGMLFKHKKDTVNIDNAIKLIRDTQGKYSIDKIARKLNLHPKQLKRKLISTIGTTPKVFSRTTRFLHLCHHLKEFENLTLTQLAYEMGYYDQAHFIKDFKMFTGFSPKEFYKQENVVFAEM